MNYRSRPKQHLRDDSIRFVITAGIMVIVAHAIAYLTHEYSHTFMAWALGWMEHPLALDYGAATPYNVLFLGDVSDNVQYEPIFAHNSGLAASVIALSGVFVGNALPYAILYRLARARVVVASRMALSFVFWLALMCAGNVWGYIPIRALTTHADIAIAARGLGISVWVLFPFLIVPALYITFHFFCRMFPRVYSTITSGSVSNLAVVIALSGYWFFAFFGGDGTDGSYGPISQLLAIASKYFLFPLSVMYLASRYMPVEQQASPPHQAPDRLSRQ